MPLNFVCVDYYRRLSHFLADSLEATTNYCAVLSVVFCMIVRGDVIAVSREVQAVDGYPCRHGCR